MKSMAKKTLMKPRAKIVRFPQKKANPFSSRRGFTLKRKRKVIRNKDFISFRYSYKNKVIRIVLRTKFGFKKRHIRLRKGGKRFRFLRNALRRKKLYKIAYTIKLLQYQFTQYTKLGTNKRVALRLLPVFNQWFWCNYSRYLNFEYYLHFRIVTFIKRLKFMRRINFKNLKVLMSQGMVVINKQKIFTLMMQVFFFDFIEFTYSRIFEYLGIFFYRRRKYWFKGLRLYRKPYWLRKRFLNKQLSKFQYQKLIIHRFKHFVKTSGRKKFMFKRRKRFLIKKRRSIFVRFIRKRRRHRSRYLDWFIFPWPKYYLRRHRKRVRVEPPRRPAPFSKLFAKYYRRVFKRAYRKSKKKKRYIPNFKKYRMKHNKKTWRIFSKRSLSVIPLSLKLGKKGRLPFKKTQKKFSRTIVQFLYFNLLSKYH